MFFGYVHFIIVIIITNRDYDHDQIVMRHIHPKVTHYDTIDLAEFMEFRSIKLSSLYT